MSGILAALQYEPTAVNGARFDIFNLGNSSPVRLSELVETLEHATGRTAIREQAPLQPGDVPLTWADISKAQNRLGYQPGTGFSEGIKRFVNWYRSMDAGRRA